MEGRANYLIDPIEEIGNGGYGVVEKIKLFNTSHHLCGLYARKLLTSGNSDKDVYQRFIREIKAQCDCLHNNIVQIFIIQPRSTETLVYYGASKAQSRR